MCIRDRVEIALNNLGYEVIRVERGLGDGDPLIGQVLEIEPLPGTELLLGSEVILIVGTGQSGPAPNLSPGDSSTGPNPNPGGSFITVEPSN